MTVPSIANHEIHGFPQVFFVNLMKSRGFSSQLNTCGCPLNIEYVLTDHAGSQHV